MENYQGDAQEVNQESVGREVKHANWYWLALILTYFLAIAVLFVLAYNKVKVRMPFYLSLALGEIIILIPTVAYLLLKEGKPLKQIQTRGLGIGNMLILVLLTYLIMPVVSFINAISMLFVENEVSTVAISLVDRPIWITIILMAVLPAIVEELAFRGILFHAYRTVDVKMAMICSGLCFGMMHLNINQFLYAFVLGMFFVLLVEATGSIYAPIIVHFVFNASNMVSSVVLMRLLRYYQSVQKQLEEQLGEKAVDTDSINAVLNGEAQTEPSLVENIISYAILGGVALLFGWFAFRAFRWLAVRCGTWDNIKGYFKRKPKQQGKRIVTAPYLVASACAGIYMILNEVIR